MITFFILLQELLFKYQRRQQISEEADRPKSEKTKIIITKTLIYNSEKPRLSAVISTSHLQF